MYMKLKNVRVIPNRIGNPSLSLEADITGMTHPIPSNIKKEKPIMAQYLSPTGTKPLLSTSAIT